MNDYQFKLSDEDLVSLQQILSQRTGQLKSRIVLCMYNLYLHMLTQFLTRIALVFHCQFIASCCWCKLRLFWLNAVAMYYVCTVYVSVCCCCLLRLWISISMVGFHYVMCITSPYPLLSQATEGIPPARPSVLGG